MGFNSSYDYEDYLSKKRGLKDRSEYRKLLLERLDVKTYYGYEKKLKQIKLCESLQKLTSNVKDPESLFSDIEFVRKITGCKIPIKKKKL